jgi:catechol 2,3-dioxygenase-like lactoylglutathione lyase family enzyme
MKLNHLNLPVADVQNARAFFEKHLDFTCIDTRPNDVLSVLKGKEDFTLVLMNGKENYPEAFHIGFFLKNEEDVNALHTRLKEDGINLGQAPQQIRKTYGFYFHLQNVLVEIAAER